MNNQLIEYRKNYIGPNFSLHYDEPLHLVKSKGLYLYDSSGNKYMDAIGNINTVGHCHEHVVKAIYNQLSILNTNTRYLYDIMEKYSKKLLRYFPKNLSVIYFVCSGSEANDLAMRMASNFTNGTEYLVIDNGYHGHTKSLIDLSPYKFNGKGGKGKKPYVHVLDMPEGVRGKYKYSEKNWIEKYIDDAKILINDVTSDKKFSAFFCESILGCGGQVVLPKNYLKEIFELVRSKGGVCISDEIQTGFGRVGNKFWAFENQDVIPDICTLGKPMGNGHPISAVITTREIADSFNNGMEYFNSFGGTPVSLAAGNAVLEVIEKEKLQNNSLVVGKYLKNKLNELKNTYSDKIIEIRGEGLFLGIDLVKNKDSCLPDEKLAKFIINYCKKLGVLISIDGPYNNVLKIKPPIIFKKNDADFLVNSIDKSFSVYE